MASVTRGRSNHRERRSAAAQRIFDATVSLLRGGERFTEIPVERLLAEAAVSRSTFYVHFADKSVLLGQLAEQVLDEIAEQVDVWWSMDYSHPQLAEATIRGTIKVYRRYSPLLRALAEVSTYDSGANALWQSRIQRYVLHLAERMHKEQHEGGIALDVDVEYTATLVIRLIDDAILDHVFQGSPRNDARLAKALARAGWLVRYGRVPDS